MLALLPLALLAAQPAAAAAPAPRPRPIDPSGWVRREDYPVQALRARKDGRVDFELDVAADGRVLGCAVTRSSGVAELDAATCIVLRERARFEPARDSAGAAVASTFRSWLHWELPPPATPHVGASLDVTRYDLASDGAIAGCAEEGDEPAEDEHCRDSVPADFLAFLRSMAPRYRTIRLVRAFTPPLYRSRLVAKGWGERIAYQRKEMVLDRRWLSFCTVRESVGPIAIIAPLCVAPPRGKPRPVAHAGNSLGYEAAIYGIGR